MKSGWCTEPDLVAPKLKCGVPLPCPYHPAPAPERAPDVFCQCSTSVPGGSYPSGVQDPAHLLGCARCGNKLRDEGETRVTGRPRDTPFPADPARDKG
jgi:hypothetical protein